MADNVAPFKTAKQYDLAWRRFEEFRGNQDEPTEEDYIEYMHHLREGGGPSGEGYKYSTLWSLYSMLNNTHQVGISLIYS